MKTSGSSDAASANNTKERDTGSSRRWNRPARGRTAARAQRTATRNKVRASLTRICGTSLPRSIPTTNGVMPTIA